MPTSGWSTSRTTSNWPGTTSPRTRRWRPPWCSARCTGTPRNGSSGPSVRDTRPGWPALPGISASTWGERVTGTAGSGNDVASKELRMSISLVKGGNLSLTKAAPNLGAIDMGLGWDARTTTGVTFDLDASALGVGEDGRVLSDQYFIFFNQKKSPEGAIEHRGDNRDGAGAGDDE